MRTRQVDLVRQSLIAPTSRDRVRSRPASDLDLVSIELSLVGAQARAAGLASIADNDDPAYRGLVEKIDAALVDLSTLRDVRSS